MKLMPNEEAISYSNGITFTNFRIRDTTNKYSDTSFTSILLENVQSISMKYKSNPLLFVIGVLLILASAAVSEGKGEVIIAGFLIGGVLIGYYYYTRKHYLTIASSAGSIDLLIKGQNTKTLVAYIDLVEETICKRKAQLIATIGESENTH